MRVSIMIDSLDPASSLEFYRRLFNGGGIPFTERALDGGVASLSILSPRLTFDFRKIEGITARIEAFEIVLRLPEPHKAVDALGRHRHWTREGDRMLLSDEDSNRLVLVQASSVSMSLNARGP